MPKGFWQHKTNRPDGRHRARRSSYRKTSTTRGRRCTTQQVQPCGRGAKRSGCHPLHPNRGHCPPWPQSHRSQGATIRVAVCLPRYGHDPIPSVKFARVQFGSPAFLVNLRLLLTRVHFSNDLYTICLPATARSAAQYLLAALAHHASIGGGRPRPDHHHLHTRNPSGDGCLPAVCSPLTRQAQSVSPLCRRSSLGWHEDPSRHSRSQVLLSYSSLSSAHFYRTLVGHRRSTCPTHSAPCPRAAPIGAGTKCRSCCANRAASGHAGQPTHAPSPRPRKSHWSSINAARPGCG